MQQQYVKGVPFFNDKNTKGVSFTPKMVYKKVRGWTSAQSLLYEIALKLACSAGVFWVGETLFVFVILLQPPSLIYGSGRLGRVEIVTLTVGARTGPISSSLREVSTWREQIARPKKTPGMQATLNISPPPPPHTHTHTHPF